MFKNGSAPRPIETHPSWPGWHEIGYKTWRRVAWENFLERGKAGGGLGTPVLRTSVKSSSPTAALLLFFAGLALPWRAGTRNLSLARHPTVRENHADARKISQFPASSGRKWESEFCVTRQKRGGVLTDEAWRRWHESGCKESTMERLFGVKIFRAAVRSRGEVGIVAGKLR